MVNRKLSRRRLGLGVLGVGVGLGASVAMAPRIELGPAAPRVFLPAGRSVVDVVLPSEGFKSIAILGARGSLLGMVPVGGEAAKIVRSRGPNDEDGLIPRCLGFAPSESDRSLALVVEVSGSVEVRFARTTAADERPPTVKGLKDGTELPRPLVCLPLSELDIEGYLLGTPARYVFVRVDVAVALRHAFGKVGKRMKRDPLYVSDASQWNGKRPKSDLSEPRHISHEGGCDVDIGYPADDTLASSVRDHCKGVRLDGEHFGCSPGTAKGVDFERLAYFLGILAEENLLAKVFMDDAYRREVPGAAKSLVERGYLKAAVLDTLGEDGVVVASPWHTDHFHVRFIGEKGRTPFAD